LQIRTFNKLFRTAKPLVGAVHLEALPGAPGWGGSMERVIVAAVSDAEALVKGGSDGLIIENFGDIPFFRDRVPPHTIAAMTAVGVKIRERFPKIPFGVNVLRNDAAAALGVACSIGADFIRVNIHTGVCVTDQGLIEGRAEETLRLRRSLQCSVLIFADVNVKHASPMDAREIGALAKETVERGLADAIIITGGATGTIAQSAEISRVREVVTAPIIVGSGITPASIASYIAKADGFIVGTYLKRGGRIENRVDTARVGKLVSTVKGLRQSRK